MKRQNMDFSYSFIVKNGVGILVLVLVIIDMVLGMLLIAYGS